MDTQNLQNNKKVWLYLGASACLILLFGIIYIGLSFQKIGQEGLMCVSNPIGYAGRLFELQGESDILCQCIKDTRLDYNKFNISINYTG